MYYNDNMDRNKQLERVKPLASHNKRWKRYTRYLKGAKNV